VAVQRPDHCNVDHQVALFERWLSERDLLGYLIAKPDAPQFFDEVERQDLGSTASSIYYALPEENSDAIGWERRYHGTYVYTLWNILLSGLRHSGRKGEGGDTHLSTPVVYTTPLKKLAYDYAPPHQVFGNGFLFKVVLDVRAFDECKVAESHKNRHNWEIGYKSHHVKLAGFWLFVDTHAEQNDSRILEWDCKMETIPKAVVTAWAKSGLDIETTFPRTLSDDASTMSPLSLTAWEDRVLVD
jgi:hypothetical protein